MFFFYALRNAYELIPSLDCCFFSVAVGKGCIETAFTGVPYFHVFSFGKASNELVNNFSKTSRSVR